MKRRDLYIYMQGLNSVTDLKGVKFAYSVIKNKKKIEDEIKIFEEVIKPDPAYEEYELKRISLCEIHSDKDEDGKPIVIADKYKLTNVDIFNEELEKLKFNYKDIIDERMKQINEYNKILDETMVIDITKISFNDLPENITPKQLESIIFMVDME
jgi:hypothetical protein